MDSKSHGKPAALLIADLAVINGMVMGILYLSSQQWGEGILVVALAVIGGFYLIKNGVYWPGQHYNSERYGLAGPPVTSATGSSSIYVQFFGSLAILLGYKIRLASLFIVAHFLVAVGI